MLAVSIEVVSGAVSKPRNCSTDEEALRLIADFVRQMKEWPGYEAWVLLFEDGKEISREHVKN
jgi:hypothetical protein